MNQVLAVYVDGQAGTTALKISELLLERSDVDVLRLPEESRKDDGARRDAIQQSDLTILCLPDDPARQAAAWAGECGTRVIDASTAHRVSEGWVYGLPELSTEAREAIRRADRVANPGCYPTSFILMVKPLIEKQLLPASAPLVVHALSGYSGGGRQMIEKWESGDLASLPYSAPYALRRKHKHVPEMMQYAGLETEPAFLPRVGAFAQGMRVEVPLHASSSADKRLPLAEAAFAVLRDRYLDEPCVTVRLHDDADAAETRFDPRACNGTNRVELNVCPNESGHVLLIGVLDNLGKGAGGAAVQCMNLMFGFEETAGLEI